MIIGTNKAKTHTNQDLAGTVCATPVTITLPDPAADTNVVCTTGTATTLTSTTAAMQQLFTAFGTVNADRVSKVARVALAAVRTGGGVFSWTNPEAGSILITRVLLDVTTASTGASTIDVGTTATTSTTSSDNLVDGASGATIAVLGNLGNAGTNGKTVQKLATGKWVTASEASGDVTGLAGYAYIHYVNI